MRYLFFCIQSVPIFEAMLESETRRNRYTDTKVAMEQGLGKSFWELGKYN